MDSQPRWIVTADARRATLFACRNVAGAGVQVEQVRSLKNPHEDEHEHQRPALLGGAERSGSPRSASSHAAPHSVAPGHEVEEERRRFARDVRDWLSDNVDSMGIRHVMLFAPPRFLGLLRLHISDRDDRTDLVEGDIAQLSAEQLAVHPAVLAMLGQYTKSA